MLTKGFDPLVFRGPHSKGTPRPSAPERDADGSTAAYKVIKEEIKKKYDSWLSNSFMWTWSDFRESAGGPN